MPERLVDRRLAFYTQDLLTEAGIVFDVSPAVLEALRNRHYSWLLQGEVQFVLSEWVEIRAGSPLPAVRHLAYLHCSRRASFIYTTTCFRDADGDGRLDSVARLLPSDIPREGLRFQPIEPIPYRYVQQQRMPVPGRAGPHVGPRLGLAWNHDHEDRASGRLFFYAQVLGGNYRINIDPPVEVDPARLPATIEIAGAQFTVLAWDGRRPTVRVDRPFPDRPIRLISPTGTLTLDFLGNLHRNWRLEAIEAPLPGTPPQ